jgi:hypothetical protein
MSGDGQSDTQPSTISIDHPIRRSFMGGAFPPPIGNRETP